MPNRSWIEYYSRWVYLHAEQHDIDIHRVVVLAERRRRAEQETEGKENAQASTL
jgi:hypothetical protein